MACSSARSAPCCSPESASPRSKCGKLSVRVLVEASASSRMPPCKRSSTRHRRRRSPGVPPSSACRTAPPSKRSFVSTKKLPSRITVEGLDRAPHRAFLRSLGLSDADLAKPFVGVASTDGRVTPCNALLGEFAREAAGAVREHGGAPFDFASISVADSMSMNHAGMRYSLVSREIIADGVEAVARGHAYDGLVCFAGCDKTLPGMMMAMVRLNLPSVFVYGGAALPGQWKGRDVTVLDTYEAVGAVMAGDMRREELDELERVCLPTLGSCPGQFTANTMAMVAETLGLALPGSATLPAVAAGRDALAQRAGAAVMRLLNGGPLPRELVTKKSLENACAAVAATGGSTNAALHIPAIAHEAGIRFSMDDFARVAKRTPLIADLKPGGRFLAKDLHAVGGVYAVLKALLAHGALHGECLTIFGTSLEEELETRPEADGTVVKKDPISKTGGLVVLKGNLAPDGALIKVAGLKSLVFEGRARVFDSEEACSEVVKKKKYKAGDVLVI